MKLDTITQIMTTFIWIVSINQHNIWILVDATQQALQFFVHRHNVKAQATKQEVNGYNDRDRRQSSDGLSDVTDFTHGTVGCVEKVPNYKKINQ